MKIAFDVVCLNKLAFDAVCLNVFVFGVIDVIIRIVSAFRRYEVNLLTGIEGRKGDWQHCSRTHKTRRPERPHSSSESPPSRLMYKEPQTLVILSARKPPRTSCPAAHFRPHNRSPALITPPAPLAPPT